MTTGAGDGFRDRLVLDDEAYDGGNISNSSNRKSRVSAIHVAPRNSLDNVGDQALTSVR